MFKYIYMIYVNVMYVYIYIHRLYTHMHIRNLLLAMGPLVSGKGT
jgi:hypothetical protein